MADTIAVMNGGRVEELGPPAELYEHPATTFVANFLGQSNLVKAQVVGRQDGRLVLDASGSKVVMPAERAATESEAVWMGVRPEKIHLTPQGQTTSVAEANTLDGTVTDSSFMGVSTQYVVRLAWGQEVMVFAQNIASDSGFRRGDQVTLHWDPDHTFALDASQDAAAGAGLGDDSRAVVSVGS